MERDKTTGDFVPDPANAEFERLLQDYQAAYRGLHYRASLPIRTTLAIRRRLAPVFAVAGLAALAIGLTIGLGVDSRNPDPSRIAVLSTTDRPLSLRPRAAATRTRPVVAEQGARPVRPPLRIRIRLPARPGRSSG